MHVNFRIWCIRILGTVCPSFVHDDVFDPSFVESKCHDEVLDAGLDVVDLAFATGRNLQDISGWDIEFVKNQFGQARLAETRGACQHQMRQAPIGDPFIDFLALFLVPPHVV